MYSDIFSGNFVPNNGVGLTRTRQHYNLHGLMEVDLHLLRVRERVEYKVAVLTYKALNGLAPPYLSSAFTLVADVPSRRRLRSASTDQLLVPSYRRSTIGRRAFPIAGARVWNALPSDVTSAPSLAVFGRRLKTELFRCCYNAA